MKVAVANAGNPDYFTPKAMKFFGTKIHGGIIGGRYFITSDFKNFERTERGYTARWFEIGANGNMVGHTAFDTVGYFATEADAREWISLLAQ
jgi:hypothetical protein